MGMDQAGVDQAGVDQAGAAQVGAGANASCPTGCTATALRPSDFAA
jgi:hypothetical protein